MLPRQYIPSPVGEGASPRLPSSPHLHDATMHPDAQMSSCTHQGRMEAAVQHSSDQQKTMQNSTQNLNDTH